MSRKNSNDAIDNLKKRLEKEIENKNKYYKNYQEDKEANVGFLGGIKDILIDSYNNIDKAAEDMQSFGKYAWDCWHSFHEDLLNIYNGHIRANSIDALGNLINWSANSYNKYNSSFYNYEYWRPYKEEYRLERFNIIKGELDKLNNMYKKWYEESSSDCDETKNRISNENEIIKNITEYKNLFVTALDNGIRQYKQRNIATNIEKEKKTISIFEAIKNDDFKAFQYSFENGVDLSVCNSDGFNPLTYSVHFGNNAMVEYMLKHGAESSIKDRRGYNPFHTAVENQFKDICKILLDDNPDLISTKTDAGETVEQLADKHVFSKWIKNEISNAF